MKPNKSVDDYINDLTPEQKAQMDLIRSTVKKLQPDVTELISYGVPAFRYKKRILLYYAAFKNHISIFPASDEMEKVVGPEIGSYRVSKGTLQFSKDKPLHLDLLDKIIKFRIAVVDSKKS